jgi:hypothetical protein
MEYHESTLQNSKIRPQTQVAETLTAKVRVMMTPKGLPQQNVVAECEEQFKRRE